VANFPVKNGLGNDKFLKASGAGTDLDPQIPEHKETSAAAIAASANSLDTKTPALGQALAAASTPVVLPAAQITALTPPAPITGYATAANQTTGNASLIDLLTALASLLTELQLKANLDETQPISLASQPLPTGAATQATLASLLTELQAKANLAQTQPVSAASLPLPAGAATQTTLASLLTELAGKADLTETQPVSVAAMPLPTGAATQTTLASLLTELQGKADLAETQPVSAVTLPLPSGAATAANQGTSNTSLSSIDTKTPALGQALSAASRPVVLPAAQITALTPPAAITGYATESTLDTRFGSLTETAPATDTASSGVNGRLQRLAQKLTSLIALFPTSVGQKAKTGSLAVTLASDEDLLAIQGSVTETAPATDTASSGLNGRLQRLAQKLTSLIALLPTSVGQKAKNAALAVTLASDEDLLAINGPVTETAPATDTASSGLNGRLQRIAQRLTSLIALLPASLGQKTKSASLPVTLASDEDLLARQGALTETAPSTDTASSGLNGRLQRIAQNATTGNGTLASLLTELQGKADLAETQPVSAAALPLPTGASTETTLNSLYNAFGQASATAWSGTGNGSLMQLQKAIYGLLVATLTVDVVDSGGAPISATNPFQVQIGQLLASQDSVQANQYAMGDSGAVVAVRVPTHHTTNVNSSMAVNGSSSVVAAPAAGIKNYIFHMRVSMEVGTNVAGSLFTLLDGVGGTVIERFRLNPGVSTDLWFPNGALVLSAANALYIKNQSAATCTNVEWACSYAQGT
jgi:hypothetical protein